MEAWAGMTSAGFGQLFAQAGCEGWLYAADIDGEAEVSAGGDELVVAASVFKVAVALEVLTQAATRRLDPGKRIQVSPSQRTPGPTGLSVFADEADLSVRDLVMMMLTVSDNAATDILIDLAGLDAIHATLTSIGLRRTIIRGPAARRTRLDRPRRRLRRMDRPRTGFRNVLRPGRAARPGELPARACA